MREKMPAAGKDRAAERGCDRVEELMAYLYDEAQPSESRDFREHLDACAVCSAELTAFGEVRRSVALWRAEAEVNAPALGSAEGFEAHAPLAYALPARRRSAVAALREFFALSPLRLRAATLAATLIVCAAATLILSHSEVIWDERGLTFRIGLHAGTTEPAVVVEGIPAPVSAEQSGYTAEQVERIVAERVADELAAERRRASLADRRAATSTAAHATKRQVPRVVSAAGKSNTERRAMPVNTGTRRGTLAVTDEEGLPRLSDLLGGAYD